MQDRDNMPLVDDDYEAIRTLKSWYAECADGKYTDAHQKKPQQELDAIAWKQAMCFTEDAEWDAGVFGVLQGRGALFENFRTKPWLFTMHFFMNPRIVVQEDRGYGRWALWMVATEEGSGRPMHLCGYTTDDYRKIGGRWYFSRVVLTQKFLVPFGQPWSPPVS